jgi:hypothetical protein
VAEVNSPTYFPRFNVLAGETGPEVMTVLARPRTVDVAGLRAQIGMAAGHQLAIVEAAALGRIGEAGPPGFWPGLGGGGSSGRIEILVRHSDKAEVEIVNKAEAHAVVRVTREMGSDSNLSRLTKTIVR